MSPFLFNSIEDLFAGVLDVTTESLAPSGWEWRFTSLLGFRFFGAQDDGLLGGSLAIPTTPQMTDVNPNRWGTDEQP